MASRPPSRLKGESEGRDTSSERAQILRIRRRLEGVNKREKDLEGRIDTVESAGSTAIFVLYAPEDPTPKVPSASDIVGGASDPTWTGNGDWTTTLNDDSVFMAQSIYRDEWGEFRRTRIQGEGGSDAQKFYLAFPDGDKLKNSQGELTIVGRVNEGGSNRPLLKSSGYQIYLGEDQLGEDAGEPAGGANLKYRVGAEDIDSEETVRLYDENGQVLSARTVVDVTDGVSASLRLVRGQLQYYKPAGEAWETGETVLEGVFQQGGTVVDRTQVTVEWDGSTFTVQKDSGDARVEVDREGSSAVDVEVTYTTDSGVQKTVSKTVSAITAGDPGKPGTQYFIHASEGRTLRNSEGELPLKVMRTVGDEREPVKVGATYLHTKDDNGNYHPISSTNSIGAPNNFQVTVRADQIDEDLTVYLAKRVSSDPVQESDIVDSVQITDLTESVVGIISMPEGSLSYYRGPEGTWQTGTTTLEAEFFQGTSLKARTYADVTWEANPKSVAVKGDLSSLNGVEDQSRYKVDGTSTFWELDTDRTSPSGDEVGWDPDGDGTNDGVWFDTERESDHLFSVNKEPSDQSGYKDTGNLSITANTGAPLGEDGESIDISFRYVYTPPSTVSTKSDLADIATADASQGSQYFVEETETYWRLDEEDTVPGTDQVGWDPNGDSSFEGVWTDTGETSVVVTETKTIFAVASGEPTIERYIRPTNGVAIRNSDPSKTLGLEIVEAQGGADSVLASGPFLLYYEDDTGTFQTLDNLPNVSSNYQPSIGADAISEGTLDVYLQDTRNGTPGSTVDTISLSDITDGMGGHYIKAPDGREVTHYTVDQVPGGVPIDPEVLTYRSVFVPPDESRSKRKQDVDFEFTETGGSLEVTNIGEDLAADGDPAKTHADVSVVVEDDAGSVVYELAGDGTTVINNLPVTSPTRLIVRFTFDDSQTEETTSVEEQISFSKDPASFELDPIDGETIKNGSGQVRFDVIKRDKNGSRTLTESEVDGSSTYDVQLVKNDTTTKDVDDGAGTIHTVKPDGTILDDSGTQVGTSDSPPDTEAGRIYLDETDIDGDDVLQVHDGSAVLASVRVLDVIDGTDGADSVDVELERVPQDLIYRWDQDAESWNRTTDTTINVTVYRGPDQLASGSVDVSLDTTSETLSYDDSSLGSDIDLFVNGNQTGRLGLEFSYTYVPNDAVSAKSNLSSISKAEVVDGERRYVEGTSSWWSLDTTRTSANSGEVAWNPDGDETDGVWTDTGENSVYTASAQVLAVREGEHGETFELLLPEGSLLKNSQGSLEVQAQISKGPTDRVLTESDGVRVSKNGSLITTFQGISEVDPTNGELYFTVNATGVDGQSDIFLREYYDGNGDGTKTLQEKLKSVTLADLTESIIPSISYSGKKVYFQNGDQTWETGTTTITAEFYQGPGSTPEATAKIDVTWDGSAFSTDASAYSNPASVSISESIYSYSAEIEFTYTNAAGVQQVAIGEIDAMQSGEGGDDAQTVRLEAEGQVFVEDNDGNFTPGEIQLTASQENIDTSNPNFGFTWTDGSGNSLGTGSQITIQPSQVSGSLQVTLAEDSTGLTDKTTLVRASNGQDSLSAVLTNPSHTYSSGPNGDVSDYSTGETTIRAWEGNTQLSEGSGTPGFTVSIASENGVTGSLSGATYTPTDMDGEEGTVDLDVEITRSDPSLPTETRTVTASYSKSVEGAKAPLLKLLAPTKTFTDLQDAPGYDPESITLALAYQNISNPSFTWTDVNGNELGTGTSVTIEPWQMTNGSIEVTLEESSTGLTDVVTLVEVREGTEGFTAVLSNENHAFPSTIDGEVVNYDTGDCAINVYEGARKLTVDQTPKTSGVAYSTISTEGNTTFDLEVDETNVSGTLDKNQQHKIVYRPDNMTADEANVLVTITVTRADGSTEKIDREITYVKSKAAESAHIEASGLVLERDDDGNYAPDPDGDGTAEAILTGKAPNVTAVNASFDWTFNSGDVSDILDQKSIEVTPSMLKDDGTLEVTMTETYSGQTDKVTIAEVQAGSDAVQTVLTNENHTYPADDTGSIKTQLKNGETDIEVYEGDTQLTIDQSGTPDPGTYTVSKSETEIDGDLSLTNGQKVGTYTPTGWPNDDTETAEAVLTITVQPTDAEKAEKTRTRKVTYSKAISGAASKTVSVDAPSQVFRLANDGSYTPSVITLSGNSENITGPKYDWDIGNNDQNIITDQDTVDVTPSDLTDGRVVVEMTEQNTGKTDKVTLVEVAAGSDALTGFLTNPSHIFPSGANGNVTNYEGGSTSANMYEGATQLTAVKNLLGVGAGPPKSATITSGFVHKYLSDEPISNLGLSVGDDVSFQVAIKSSGSQYGRAKIVFKDSGGSVIASATGGEITNGSYQQSEVQGHTIPANTTDITVGVEAESVSSGNENTITIRRAIFRSGPRAVPTETFTAWRDPSDNDNDGNDVTGSTSVSGYDWTFEPTNIEKDVDRSNVALTIFGRREDGTTGIINLIASYTKAKAGGAAYIEPSALVFKQRQDGTHDPADITLYGRAPEVDGPKFDWDEGADGSIDHEDTPSITINHSVLDSNGGSFKVQMTETETGRTDTVTLTEVVEGSNAINVILGNESHTFFASAEGVVQTPASGECNITVYEGDTQLEIGSWPNPGDAKYKAEIVGTQDVNGSLDTSSSTTVATFTPEADENGVVMDVPAGTDEGTVDIKITPVRENGTEADSITRTITYSRVRPGESTHIQAPSLAFAKQKDDSHNPSSITLEGKAPNVNGTPTFTWTKQTSGGDPLNSPTGTGDKNQEIVPGNLNGSGVVEVKMTEGLTGHTDKVTLVEVEEGDDALQVALTNENHTYPAENDGTISVDLSGGNCEIYVYEGNNQLTNGSGDGTFSVSIGGRDGIGTGDSLDSSTYSDRTVYKPGGSDGNNTISKDSATVTLDITVTKANGNDETLTRTITYSKSRKGDQGPKGDNAKSVRIEAEALVFIDRQDDSFDPETIALMATEQNISDPDYEWSSSNTEYTDTGATTTVEPYQLDDQGRLKLTLTETGSGATDSITILGVEEGDDSLTVALGNENHTYRAQPDGTIDDYAPGNCEIIAYEGADQLTVDQTPKTSSVAYSTISTEGDTTFDAEKNESGISGTLDKNQQNKIIYKPQSVSDAVEEATVEITVTMTRASGATEKETRQITYSRVRSEEFYEIRTLDGEAIKNSQGTISLEIVRVSDTEETIINSGEDYKIRSKEDDGNGGYVYEPVGTAGSSVTLDSGDAQEPVFGESNIEGSLVVYLGDGNNEADIVDSIALADVTDGLATGYVNKPQTFITHLAGPEMDTVNPTNLTFTGVFVDVNGNSHKQDIDFTCTEDSDGHLNVEWDFDSLANSSSQVDVTVKALDTELETNSNGSIDADDAQQGLGGAYVAEIVVEFTGEDPNTEDTSTFSEQLQLRRDYGFYKIDALDGTDLKIGNNDTLRFEARRTDGNQPDRVMPLNGKGLQLVLLEQSGGTVKSTWPPALQQSAEPTAGDFYSGGSPSLQGGEIWYDTDTNTRKWYDASSGTWGTTPIDYTSQITLGETDITESDILQLQTDDPNNDGNGAILDSERIQGLSDGIDGGFVETPKGVGVTYYTDGSPNTDDDRISPQTLSVDGVYITINEAEKRTNLNVETKMVDGGGMKAKWVRQSRTELDSVTVTRLRSDGTTTELNHDQWYDPGRSWEFKFRMTEPATGNEIPPFKTNVLFEEDDALYTIKHPNGTEFTADPDTGNVDPDFLTFKARKADSDPDVPNKIVNLDDNPYRIEVYDDTNAADPSAIFSTAYNGGGSARNGKVITDGDGNDMAKVLPDDIYRSAELHLVKDPGGEDTVLETESPADLREGTDGGETRIMSTSVTKGTDDWKWNRDTEEWTPPANVDTTGDGTADTRRTTITAEVNRGPDLLGKATVTLELTESDGTLAQHSTNVEKTGPNGSTWDINKVTAESDGTDNAKVKFKYTDKSKAKPWDPLVEYEEGDLVYYEGSAGANGNYRANKSTTAGTKPPNATGTGEGDGQWDGPVTIVLEKTHTVKATKDGRNSAAPVQISAPTEVFVLKSGGQYGNDSDWVNPTIDLSVALGNIPTPVSSYSWSIDYGGDGEDSTDSGSTTPLNHPSSSGVTKIVVNLTVVDAENKTHEDSETFHVLKEGGDGFTLSVENEETEYQINADGEVIGDLVDGTAKFRIYEGAERLSIDSVDVTNVDPTGEITPQAGESNSDGPGNGLRIDTDSGGDVGVYEPQGVDSNGFGGATVTVKITATQQNGDSIEREANVRYFASETIVVLANERAQAARELGDNADGAYVSNAAIGHLVPLPDGDDPGNDTYQARRWRSYLSKTGDLYLNDDEDGQALEYLAEWDADGDGTIDTQRGIFMIGDLSAAKNYFGPVSGYGGGEPTGYNPDGSGGYQNSYPAGEESFFGYHRGVIALNGRMAGTIGGAGGDELVIGDDGRVVSSPKSDFGSGESAYNQPGEVFFGADPDDGSSPHPKKFSLGDRFTYDPNRDPEVHLIGRLETVRSSPDPNEQFMTAVRVDNDYEYNQAPEGSTGSQSLSVTSQGGSESTGYTLSRGANSIEITANGKAGKIEFPDFSGTIAAPAVVYMRFYAEPSGTTLGRRVISIESDTNTDVTETYAIEAPASVDGEILWVEAEYMLKPTADGSNGNIDLTNARYKNFTPVTEINASGVKVSLGEDFSGSEQYVRMGSGGFVSTVGMLSSSYAFTNGGGKLVDNGSGLYYVSGTTSRRLDAKKVAGFIEEADKLDGNHGAYYLKWSEFTGKPSGLYSENGDSDGIPETVALDNAAVTGALDLSSSTYLKISSGSLIAQVKDEDDMSSNSASHLATQQSIKAYVDSETSSTTASDLQGDGLKASGGVLDIEPSDFAGTGLTDEGGDDLGIADGGVGTAQLAQQDFVKFADKEQSDYSKDGRIWYDQSAGLYVHYGSASSSPDESTGSALMWNDKNVSEGNNINITTDSEAVPTIGVDETNLNADTVDGYEGSDLAALAESETITDTWTFSSDIILNSSNLKTSGASTGHGSGSGTIIDADTSWFDNVEVRGTMFVSEFEIKKLAVSRGTQIFGPGGGKVQGIPDADYFRNPPEVTLEFEEPPGIEKNDLCLIKEVDADSATASAVIKMRCYDPADEGDSGPSPGGSRMRFKVTSRDRDIEVGDDVVVIGTSDTSSDRDALLTANPFGPHFDVIDGIHTHGMWNSRTPKVRMGELGGLPDLSDGTTPSGRGFFAKGNAYLDGTIVTSSGRIGGWTIDDHKMYHDAGIGTGKLFITNAAKHLPQASDGDNTSGRWAGEAGDTPTIAMIQGSDSSNRVFVHMGETYSNGSSESGFTGRKGFSITPGKTDKAVFEVSWDPSNSETVAYINNLELRDLRAIGTITMGDSNNDGIIKSNDDIFEISDSRGFNLFASNTFAYGRAYTIHDENYWNGTKYTDPAVVVLESIVEDGNEKVLGRLDCRHPGTASGNPGDWSTQLDLRSDEIYLYAKDGNGKGINLMTQLGSVEIEGGLFKGQVYSGDYQWANGNVDPRIVTSGNGTVAQFNGGTAPYRLNEQDGHGRISWLWNAYDDGSDTHKFDVANEGATWFRTHDTTFEFYISDVNSSSKDEIITWKNMLQIDRGGITTDGYVRAGGDVVADYSSDRRLKENLSPIGSADILSAIDGYSFRWNDRAEDFRRGTRSHGVIAQEVREVMPEAVTERTDGTLAVDYRQLVPVLISESNAQRRRIEALEKAVSDLQGSA